MADWMPLWATFLECGFFMTIASSNSTSLGLSRHVTGPGPILDSNRRKTKEQHTQEHEFLDPKLFINPRPIMKGIRENTRGLGKWSSLRGADSEGASGADDHELADMNTTDTAERTHQ